MKVSALYIAQVKRKYGLHIGKVYVRTAEQGAAIPKCPREKGKAIMDALKHFRMMDQSVKLKEEGDET